MTIPLYTDSTLLRSAKTLSFISLSGLAFQSATPLKSSANSMSL